MTKEKSANDLEHPTYEKVPRRDMGRDCPDDKELEIDKPTLPGWPGWRRPE